MSRDKKGAPNAPFAKGGRAQRGGILPLHDALAVVADRLYQRDPARYAKLIVWIRDALKRGWSVDRIRRSLLALDKREVESARRADQDGSPSRPPVDAWWPWLNAALEKVRTKDLEKENDGYKHGQPNHIKAIIAQVAREIAADKIPRSAAPSPPPLPKGADRRSATGGGI